MQRFNKQWIRTLCLLLGVFLTTASYALDSDKNQPLTIDADYVKVDKLKHLTEFEGNVHIKQGSTEITGDKVTIHFDEENKAKQIMIDGQLAHYKTQLNETPNAPPFEAQAQRINAFPQTHKIELIGKAKAWQAKDRYEGAHLIYWTHTQTVVSPRSSEGRAVVVIQPNRFSNTNTQKG